MLTLIKRRRFRRYVKIVFGIVAFVFIIGFALDVSNVGQRNDALVAAKVGDTVISTMELSKIYQQQLRDRYKDLTPEQRKQLALPRQLLDELIESHLLLDEAPKLGLVVGADELREDIENRSYFQEGGRFSMARYRRILSQTGASPAQFESAERDNLTLRKVDALLGALVYVPSRQVERVALVENAKINVQVLEVDPDELAKSLKPGGAELRAWFSGQRAEYKTEEKRAISYVEFASQDAVSSAIVALGEARDLGAKAAELGWELKKTTKLTRNGTIEGVKESNNVLAQAFLLSRDEVGPPLKAGDTYYLIRVDGVEEPREAEFDDVEARVRADWVKEKSIERAKELAGEKLSAARKRGLDLKKLGSKGPFKTYETGAFSANAYSIPNIGDSKEFKIAAFGLGPDRRYPESPVQVGRKWYVLRLVSQDLPSAEAWPEKKLNALDDLMRLKRFEILRHWRQVLRDQSEIEINEKALEGLI